MIHDQFYAASTVILGELLHFLETIKLMNLMSTRGLSLEVVVLRPTEMKTIIRSVPIVFG